MQFLSDVVYADELASTVGQIDGMLNILAIVDHYDSRQCGTDSW